MKNLYKFAALLGILLTCTMSCEQWTIEEKTSTHNGTIATENNLMGSAVTAADYGGSLPLVSIQCPDDGDEVVAADIRGPVAALLAADELQTDDIAALDLAKANRAGDTFTGYVNLDAGASVGQGQPLLLTQALLQSGFGANAMFITGMATFTSRKVLNRARVPLADADHTVDVGDADRFTLAVNPAAPRTITLKSTGTLAEVPIEGETMTFFWFPKTAAVGAGTQYTFEREDNTIVSTFDGSAAIDTGLVWAEFEYTPSGWRLGKNSGTLHDGAAYYGVVGGAGS